MIFLPQTHFCSHNLFSKWNWRLNRNFAEVESTFLFLFPPFFIILLLIILYRILFYLKKKRKEGEGLVTNLLILSLIFFTPSHVNNQNEKKGNVNASGNKRLISIKRPAKAPNHRVLSTGATERYVFRSRILNPPSLFFFFFYLL